MALDLRGAGIGNVLLMVAGYLEEKERLEVSDEGVEEPRLYHDCPDQLFFISPSIPRAAVPLADEPVRLAPPKQYVSLSQLARENVQQRMRAVLRIPPALVEGIDALLEGVDAGFHVRVSSPLDSGFAFMNDAALSAMLALVAQYTRPFVCSNSRGVEEHVAREFPHAVLLPWTGPECARNDAAHIRPWYALSRCPVVVHAVGGQGALASTFAATAAVVGRRRLVGIDNRGRVLTGTSYHW